MHRRVHGAHPNAVSAWVETLWSTRRPASGIMSWERHPAADFAGEIEQIRHSLGLARGYSAGLRLNFILHLSYIAVKEVNELIVLLPWTNMVKMGPNVAKNS